MKSIPFKDVKPGDVVLRYADGEPRKVERAQGTVLVFKNNEAINGTPNQLIGLVHRPWPEGKTEEEMLDAVINAAHRPGVFHSYRLSELRAALDAYELGELLYEEPQNESLRDRHMSP